MTLPRCTHAPTGAAADLAARFQSLIPRLETERLVLRAPTLADFPVWVGLFEDEETEFEGGAEGAWDEYTNYIAGWMLHGHGLMAIETKSDSKTVGFVLLGLEWEDFEPELGWMLAKSARGHGYATEAAVALRDFGLDLLGPGNFVSYIYQDNTASQAVANRIGATFDDTVPGEPDTLIYRHGDRA